MNTPNGAPAISKPNKTNYYFLLNENMNNIKMKFNQFSITKIKDLINYRDLIILTTTIDFKQKYKNSVLGFFWSLCEPIVIFIILYSVFNNIIRYEIQYYAMFILYGIFFWNFFSRSTSSALFSILSKSSMIKKIYFPREIVIISNTATSFMLTIVELIIFFIMLLLFQIPVSIWIIEGLYVLIMFSIFTMGISFIVSSLNVFYRDTQFIWNIILQGGFFLTPIFYSTDILGDKMKLLSILNPLTIYLNSSRDSILYSLPIDFMLILFITIFSFSTLIVGYLIFLHYEPIFAEEI